jgi:hypothetical protein
MATPEGGKYWRVAYRFDRKQRTLAIGTYPAVSLKDARVARDNAKRDLAAGLNPSQKKKLDKLAAAALSLNTFGAFTELLAKKAREGNYSWQARTDARSGVAGFGVPARFAPSPRPKCWPCCVGQRRAGG